jgi:hypothetical protein
MTVDTVAAGTELFGGVTLLRRAAEALDAFARKVRRYGH